MWPAFLSHDLPLTLRGPPRTRTRSPVACARGKPAASKGRLRLPTRGRLFAGSGALSLALSLLNRLALTPADVSPFQARSDILGVVCGVSLLLYGAGLAEVAERGARVELQGVDTPLECTLDRRAAEEAEFIAAAALNAVPNFVSVAFFLDGRSTRRAHQGDEFPFLPQECQAVVVVPCGKRGAVMLGSDKVRPMLGSDFGWLTALCNRLAIRVES